jgi:hypothetical protein
MEAVFLTSLCGIIASTILAISSNDAVVKECMLWVLLICWPLLLWSSHVKATKNNK